MKKISIIILSLIIGLVSIGTRTSDVSAIYVDNKDRTWYTVPELLEYKEQYDREAEEICGNDFYCLEELYFSKMDSGESKFQALEQLTQQQIVMTAINPGEETIKVLFFDEDMMMKHMGVSEPLTLGEFYMGWFEYDSNRIFNYGIYSDELFADSLPGAHMVYAQMDNFGDRILANQEFELSVNGSNLIENTSGVISYAAFADPYFNTMGYFGYTSCLMEPDYVEGTECRLMFSAEEGYRYFPPRETFLVDERTDVVMMTTGDDSKKEDESEGVADVDSDTDTNTDTDDADNDDMVKEEDNETNMEEGNGERMDINENVKDESASLSSSGTNIKSPNTGAGPCVQKTIEFPWWLMVLIAIGDAVILWLFWPKSLKKSKKVLDKKLRVR